MARRGVGRLSARGLISCGRTGTLAFGLLGPPSGFTGLSGAGEGTHKDERAGASWYAPSCYAWPMESMSGKQQILDALRDLPEDATVDDAIERLVFLAKVREGLAQLDAGRSLDHDAVKRRLGL